MARKSRKKLDEIIKTESRYMNVAIYIRLSVEDNQNKGCSVESQKMIIENYISIRPEFKVYDTYIDNGFSGANFNRADFNRMIEDIEKGYVNCVIVKDLSRLGRNAVYTGYYIENYFNLHNIRFIAVTDNIDTFEADSHTKQIIIPFKNMLNESHVINTSKKIKAQKHQAMKDGDMIGGTAPYGYVRSKEDKHKLEIDEYSSAIVKDIFERYYNGESMLSISRLLNENDIACPKVYKNSISKNPKQLNKIVWRTPTVRRILTNLAYVGDMVQGKTRVISGHQIKTDKTEYIVVKNTHTPLVSREIFNAVQLRLEDNSKKRNLREKRIEENIFRGKLYCANCKKTLSCGVYKGKNTDTIFYRCASNTMVAKNFCKGAYISEKRLKSIITHIIKKQTGDIFAKYPSKQSLNIEYEKEKQLFNQRMSCLANEIDKKRAFLMKLYESYVSELLSCSEYIEMQKMYKTEIEELNKQKEALSREFNETSKRLEEKNKIYDKAEVLKLGDTLSFDIVDSLIKRIEVDRDNEVTVYFKFQDKVVVW